MFSDVGAPFKLALLNWMPLDKCVCVCVCVCVKQINSIFDLSFYYYLVSYNTTGVLHSSDKMTECELTLAG